MIVNFFLYFLIILTFHIVKSNTQQIITLKKNNFISIDDKINDENVALWSKQINKLNSNPIYIYIDSPGGSVVAGLQFINNMDWLIGQGKSINCIAKSAYSMAFIILQHCNNRYVIKSSILMQHQMSLSGINGPLNNLGNYIEMIKSISDSLDSSMSARLNLTLNDYRNKISNDWWVYGQSAISAKMADSMVIVGCEQELYESDTKKEDIIFDLNLAGELELKKVESNKSLCPL